MLSLPAFKNLRSKPTFLNRKRHGRRGIVAVQVAVMSTVLFGFAALAIDVGAMYVAQSELQRAADAAAMAATAKLADYSTGDPQQLAREAAVEYACRNIVLGSCTLLEETVDVVFGQADYDAGTGKYGFTATNENPDAVQVTLHHTSDSQNGPMSLYFAPVLGHFTHNLSASATAVLLPRDIALVADLSASHTDDSELRHYKLTDINLWDVWDAMPGGLDGGGVAGNPPLGWDPNLPENVNVAGPTFGSFMGTHGWGTPNIDAGYDPAADIGLIYLPYNQSWAGNVAAQLSLLAQGYIPAEIDALLSPAYDGNESSRAVWENRTAVVLGLAEWNSGMLGGRWQLLGNNPVGNGNANVGSSEIAWQPYPYTQGGWRDWMDNYVDQSNSTMAQANSAFQYRFGVKTFMDYVLSSKPSFHQTPELANAPTQPMKAVKDSVDYMMNYLDALETQDNVSLEIYAKTSRHEVDLTNDFFMVSDRLNQMQAGHYDTWTNMAAGVIEGVKELTGSNARATARKVMVLLTDGLPNTDKSGNYNEAAAKAWAIEEATNAAAQGIKIYTVSVGANADTDLMQNIADIGGGKHAWATGTIEQYSAELEKIFEILSNERPVILIQ